jgi:acyl-CoA thioesterase
MADVPAPTLLAKRVVEKMRSVDSFSHWLGIELLTVERGRVVLRAAVRKEMLNGFGTCHGGILFSLADSAFGFAGNGQGRVAVAMECNISFTRPAYEQDVLTVTAAEQSSGNRVAVYTVTVANQRQETIALFRGTVYKLDKDHFPTDGSAS